jgi:hypothetical protein
VIPSVESREVKGIMGLIYRAFSVFLLIVLHPNWVYELKHDNVAADFSI